MVGDRLREFAGGLKVLNRKVREVTQSKTKNYTELILAYAIADNYSNY